MRKSQEHWSNVIWSSRWRLRKPSKVKSTNTELERQTLRKQPKALKFNVNDNTKKGIILVVGWQSSNYYTTIFFRTIAP